MLVRKWFKFLGLIYASFFLSADTKFRSAPSRSKNFDIDVDNTWVNYLRPSSRKNIKKNMKKRVKCVLSLLADAHVVSKKYVFFAPENAEHKFSIFGKFQSSFSRTFFSKRKERKINNNKNLRFEKGVNCVFMFSRFSSKRLMYIKWLINRDHV